MFGLLKLFFLQTSGKLPQRKNKLEPHQLANSRDERCGLIVSMLTLASFTEPSFIKAWANPAVSSSLRWVFPQQPGERPLSRMQQAEKLYCKSPKAASHAASAQLLLPGYQAN